MSAVSAQKKHYVCRAGQLPPGGRIIIDAGSRSIGVFNIGGEYYALRNLCPHQFAPLCLGKVTGYCAPSAVGEYKWERVGEIIRCPWHSWEFDIKTGRSVFNPHKVRTKSYEVRVEPDPAQNAEPAPTHDSGMCGDEEKRVETYGVTVEEGIVFVLA